MVHTLFGHRCTMATLFLIIAFALCLTPSKTQHHRVVRQCVYPVCLELTVSAEFCDRLSSQQGHGDRTHEHIQYHYNGFPRTNMWLVREKKKYFDLLYNNTVIKYKLYEF
jgi:hypothetical protein